MAQPIVLYHLHQLIFCIFLSDYFLKLHAAKIGEENFKMNQLTTASLIFIFAFSMYSKSLPKLTDL
jgi:hypothetical protein